MEAGALHAPSAGLTRLPFTGQLLRLRSDEQLVALFRAGSEEAFEAIHDRYRQRLFAYVRQMLSKGSRQDAEDVLQDVFVRAYGALAADSREVNVRAWLYRVAHNRCIDHLRRPAPAPAEIFEVNRKPLHDPVEEAQRRDDLKRLIDDIGRLPEQQRSALLMREIDGMAYADIALALDVTIPAVKSLLVRARVGLAEAVGAREESCTVIREDLAASYDRGVKASARARRHMRDCSGCREYKTALRGVKRSFAALSPGLAFGPVALAAKLGLGSAGGGAAGGAAVGGGAVSLAGTATACKVAAVVCATALTAGGAVEVKHVIADRAAKPDRAGTVAAKTPAVAPAALSAGAAAPAIRLPGPALDVPRAAPEKPVARGPAKEAPRQSAPAPAPVDEVPVPATPADPSIPAVPVTGGVLAPVEDAAAAPVKPASKDPDAAPRSGNGSAEAPSETPPQSQPAKPAQSGGSSGDGAPPAEH